MNYDNFTTLAVDVDAGVAHVTLAHGELNLIDLVMLGDLDRAGRLLEQDDDVRVVILQSANPDFFIAHADLHAIAMLPSEPAPRAEKLGLINQIYDRFRTMPKLTIAKVAGIARGGGSELALACDLRFGVRGKTIIAQPEVGLGLIPGAGGSVRLPRLVGTARALEIILGGGDIDADEAERIGYLNRALDADRFDAHVESLARRVAGFPVEALARAKTAVYFQGSLEDSLNHEEVDFLAAAHSPAARQRMDAGLQLGMQTVAGEKAALDNLWAALAGA